MLESFSRYDLYLAFVKGGPGLGDPLERSAQDVEIDLKEGFIGLRVAAQVYGVVTETNDEVIKVNADSTEQRRQQIRADRGQRAIPVSEWVALERERRVLQRDVIEPVREMYRSSMKLSPSWAAQYRAFWNLDDDFTY